MPRDDGHSVTLRQSAPAPRRKRRGGRTVDDFKSTKDIKHTEVGLGRRKLALFLMITLVDDCGQMTTAYNAVISRWGHQPGHWAHDKSLDFLQKGCGKFLGMGAEPRKLHWEKVRDLLLASGKDSAIPEAAYLFCQAVGVTESKIGYVGEKARRPAWDKKGLTTFTSPMIGGREWALRFWDADSPEVLEAEEFAGAKASVPAVAPVGAATAAEIHMLQSTKVELENLLWETVRAFREAQDANLDLRNKVNVAERELTDRQAQMDRERLALLGRQAAMEHEQQELRQEMEILLQDTKSKVESALGSVDEQIRQATDEAQKQVWELRLERQAAYKERDKHLEENLHLQRDLWRLREDVMRSLKRRNPAASNETLQRLLDDILTASSGANELTSTKDVDELDRAELEMTP